MHLAHPHGRRRFGAALAAAAVAVSSLSLTVPALAADTTPIDGPLTAGDTVFPNVGNGGYDALDYDLDIAWTPVYDASAALNDRFAQSTIEATTTMTAKATQPLRSFGMDFEGLTVDSVTVNGAPATWERISDTATIKHKLVITPAAPVTGEFSVTVAYSGVPQPHMDADGSQEGWSPVADGAMVLGQPVGMMAAYPHNNTPKDKATYRITLDVPSTITNEAGTGTAAAVSNGELVAKTVSQDGTRTTWDWKQKYPMASELTVIGIGKYDVLESDVTLSSGRTIPEWTFVDSALSEANKTTINTRRAQFSTILQGLETMFGPYPGDSTGAIIDTVPSAISYALETQDRSFFPSTSSFNGNTLIHEFVHQWYGNHVSPDDWNGLWMGEGMASWAPLYYNFAVAKTSTTNPSVNYFNSWNAMAANSRNWSIAPSGMTDSATLYGYQTYTRGAMTWEVLRQAIGDTAFFEVVREWVVQKGGTSQSVAALQAFAEDVSGRDLDALFQEWVHTPGKPTWPEASLATLSTTSTGAKLGERVTLDLTADNTGRLPLSTTQYTVDLSQVLDVASLDATSLPAELTLSGTQLTWTVPETAVGASASTAFGLTVTDASREFEAALKLSPVKLGAVCDTCVATLTVVPTDLTVTPTPRVSGRPVVAGTLKAVTGDWDAGVSLTYQWLRNGKAIARAAGSSYVVGAADAGAKISVAVTGTKPGHRAATRTSAPVGPVAKASLPSGKVAVKGAAKVGKKLTAKVRGFGDAKRSYTWKVSGKKVGSKASVKVKKSWAGKKVTLTVTATKAGYTTKKAAASKKIAKRKKR